MNSHLVAKASVGEKIKQYYVLSKFRLSVVVVFSGCFGFLLANEAPIHYLKIIAFALGSFLVTASSSAINQIIEKDLDKLMKRTQNRPLANGSMSVSEATLFAWLTGIVGTTLIIFFINYLTAFLAILSLILYAFVYTPLKQKSPIAVLVGAFPGAFPPLIGWTAANNEIFEMGAWIIFAIQFIWQFPHFWAIAWVADEDYQKAGFKMLPSQNGKDLISALQILTYTLFLIPLSFLPHLLGITGIVSAYIAVLAALLFLVPISILVRTGSRKAALLTMFASFLYLPLVQIAFLLDKI